MDQADITGGVARFIFKGGMRKDPFKSTSDREVAWIVEELRVLDPKTVIDEVDVRVIRDLVNEFRERQGEQGQQ